MSRLWLVNPPIDLDYLHALSIQEASTVDQTKVCTEKFDTVLWRTVNHVRMLHALSQCWNTLLPMSAAQGTREGQKRRPL